MTTPVSLHSITVFQTLLRAVALCLRAKGGSGQAAARKALSEHFLQETMRQLEVSSLRSQVFLYAHLNEWTTSAFGQAFALDLLAKTGGLQILM